MQLTFNIVYIPGSVRYLRLFALSLVDSADCSFRLVSNGCGPDEAHLLRDFCGRSPRLEFLALPYDRMVSHGRALSCLQSQERSAYFCFMDSDILATGQFLNEFVSLLAQHAGVFSCSPVWCTAEDQVLPATFQRMAGRYNWTEAGVCLGSSYFAIYDNRVLTSLFRSTGIDFRRYLWGELPLDHRSELSRMGLKMGLYDTGKAVNLLLLCRGHQLCFKESPALKHVGGISLEIYSGIGSWLRRYGAGFIGSLPPGRFERLLKVLTGIRAVSTARIQVSRDERQFLREKRRRRRLVSRYFGELLEALFKGQSFPQLPRNLDTETARRIRELASDVVERYAKYDQQL